MGKSTLFSVTNAVVTEALADAGVLDPHDSSINRDHFGLTISSVVGDTLDLAKI